jgi:hypothetical protein
MNRFWSAARQDSGAARAIAHMDARRLRLLVEADDAYVRLVALYALGGGEVLRMASLTVDLRTARGEFSGAERLEKGVREGLARFHPALLAGMGGILLSLPPTALRYDRLARTVTVPQDARRGQRRGVGTPQMEALDAMLEAGEVGEGEIVVEVHAEPYRLDTGLAVADPRGLVSATLTRAATRVLVDRHRLEALVTACESVGLDVERIVTVAGLAWGVAPAGQRDEGVLVVDVRSRSTEGVVFREGRVAGLYHDVSGAEDILLDAARCLGTTAPLVRREVTNVRHKLASVAWSEHGYESFDSRDEEVLSTLARLDGACARSGGTLARRFDTLWDGMCRDASVRAVCVGVDPLAVRAMVQAGRTLGWQQVAWPDADRCGPYEGQAGEPANPRDRGMMLWALDAGAPVQPPLRGRSIDPVQRAQNAVQAVVGLLARGRGPQPRLPAARFPEHAGRRLASLPALKSLLF